MTHHWTVLTRKECLASSLEALQAQAEHEATLPPGPFPDDDPTPRKRKYEHVLALSQGAEYDSIDEYLGSPSATRWECNGCEELHDKVVRLYEDEDAGCEVWMCGDCLAQATNLLEDHPAG